MQGISGLSSMNGMQPPMMGPRREEKLTDDQKSQLNEILSQYDPDDLSEEDAKSIFNALREAGIPPSKDLRSTIEAAGFNLDQFKPAERPAGPPPGLSQSMDLSSLQSLQTILNQYDLSNLSADDQESLFSQIQNAGFLTPGNLFTLEA